MLQDLLDYRNCTVMPIDSCVQGNEFCKIQASFTQILPLKIKEKCFRFWKFQLSRVPRGKKRENKGQIGKVALEMKYL